MARRSHGINRVVAFLGPLVGMYIGFLFCQLTSENTSRSSATASLTSVSRRFLNEDHHVSTMEEKEHYSQQSFDEGSAGSEEEEEDISFAVSTSVVCIVLLLILLTIGFEETKEWIEECANKNTEPIIEALFGEMTVLGFLSVFTFVVTRLGFFDELSIILFEEEELLEEIFEFVHYCLFFIMVFFVAQVLVLVKDAMAVEEEWLEMDRKCMDKRYMVRCRKRHEMIQDMAYHSKNSNIQYIREFFNLLPFQRNKKVEKVEDQVVFAQLREEFICERSFEHPFKPSDEDKQVPTDFNFGRYLGMCMAHTLTHVVEVDILCWIFFAVFTVIFYFIELLVDSDMIILGWTWVAFGWAGMIFNIHFEHHFHLIRNAFVPASRLGLRSTVMSNSHTSLSELNDSDSSLNLAALDENSKLVSDDPTLPDWCKVDMDEYMKNRNWMKRFINGPEVPPPHHTLFWFERKGGKASVLILQLNLLGVGIYCALLFLAFVPALFKEHSQVLFGAYLVFASIPVIVITLNKKHLVAVMSQTLSIGALRKPHIIANVIREEKTARVVRSFLILYKMHRAAESGFNAASNPTKMPHFSRVFDHNTLDSLSKTFDGFDKSGDGNISSDEFGSIMESLGVPLDHEKLRNMISVLDADGDGEVSKDEFLQWYADQQSIVDDLTMEERAHFLFNMFDDDMSGEITVSEFKATIDAFNFGFTVDEVGDLIKELDEDGNGTLGVEEFEELLVKYHPKELQDDSLHSRHNQSHNNGSGTFNSAYSHHHN